ncbi:MAG: sirohydrochlorin chelatase [Gammaproteobacteria bacterium]|uniref:Sirohydrochlorin chelatase n=1 Tax=Candidatus Thiopontia autotrophica TaxID=2841688 RepID=A0A8J6TS07_9GAMM|nr:sirohydrochlorin chelatase [Candidatus Thiopontia autotrophica]MBL6968999.1 sirohydrochlorin chelatase [Gammaproteobacteria bacterium]
MREKILLVGHGSRSVAGNQEIEKFAGQWRNRNREWDIDLCFIELADILIAEGLEQAAQSAEKIIVVPLILNAAGHVKEEIPEFISEAAEKFQDREFRYAKHLGVNDKILDILKRSLHNVLADMESPDPAKTGVVLLARGSSDRHANGEMAMMARWLYEESEVKQVELAFTGITSPKLEDVVQRQMAAGMTHVAILPYYLFTGTLIERIRGQVEKLRKEFPEVEFGLGNYFGFENEIFDLLDQRVIEAQR